MHLAGPGTGSQRSNLDLYQRRYRRDSKNSMIRVATVVLLLLIATLLIIFIVLARRKPDPHFMFLTEELLSEEMDVNCLIARDETVYNAPGTGVFRQLIAQGSKVSKGMRLGQLLPSGRVDELRQLDKAYNDVNDKRYALIAQGKGGDAQRIFNAGNAEIRRNLSILYDSIIAGNSAKIIEIEAELRLIMAQRVEDAESFQLDDPELDQLIDYRDRLEAGSARDLITVNSEASGIFIQALDGLEKELTKEKILNMSEAELEEYLKRAGEPKMQTEVETGKPMYKLSRSIEYYFVTLIPRNRLSHYLNENQQYKAYCSANGVTVEDLRLIRIEDTKRGQLAVFASNDSLEAFVSMRKAPLKLTLHETRGLRIPKSALVDYEEGNIEAKVKLVYGGFIRSCAVKVLATNENYAIIAQIDSARAEDEGSGPDLVKMTAENAEANGEETPSSANPPAGKAVYSQDSAYPIAVSSIILLNPDSMQEGDAIADSY